MVERRYAAAATFAEAGLRQRPSSATWLLAVAWTHLGRDQLDEALRWARRAAESGQGKDEAVVFRTLGLIYYRRGDQVAAAEAARYACRLEPNQEGRQLARLVGAEAAGDPAARSARVQRRLTAEVKLENLISRSLGRRRLAAALGVAGQGSSAGAQSESNTVPAAALRTLFGASLFGDWDPQPDLMLATGAVSRRTARLPPRLLGGLAALVACAIGVVLIVRAVSERQGSRAATALAGEVVELSGTGAIRSLAHSLDAAGAPRLGAGTRNRLAAGPGHRLSLPRCQR